MAEKLTIFKIGGKVIDDRSELTIFLRDLAEVPGKKILVHGGGQWVSDMCQRLGIKVKMTQGRRITDHETLDVVTMILPGLANKTIVAILQKFGVNAIGLTGADGNMILAKKRPVRNGIDFGYVGDIVEVNLSNIKGVLLSGFMPVFTAMTHDGQGQMLNTNADTIASSLAVTLAPEYNVELYFCFEKSGVLSDLKDEQTLIRHLDPDNYSQLKNAGEIHSGMIPKIDNAFKAIEQGVERIHICHYKDIHRLSKGDFEIGTTITK